MKRKRAALPEQEEKEFQELLGRKLTEEERRDAVTHPWILDAIRAQDRPWKMLIDQLKKRCTLEEQRNSLQEEKLKREGGLRSKNEGRKHEIEQRKRVALNITTRLLKENPLLRLPRKTSQLARRVEKELPNPPPFHTLRHWIGGWIDELKK